MVGGQINPTISIDRSSWPDRHSRPQCLRFWLWPSFTEELWDREWPDRASQTVNMKKSWPDKKGNLAYHRKRVTLVGGTPFKQSQLFVSPCWSLAKFCKKVGSPEVARVSGTWENFSPYKRGLFSQCMPSWHNTSQLDMLTGGVNKYLHTTSALYIRNKILFWYVFSQISFWDGFENGFGSQKWIY